MPDRFVARTGGAPYALIPVLAVAFLQIGVASVSGAFTATSTTLTGLFLWVPVALLLQLVQRLMRRTARPVASRGLIGVYAFSSWAVGCLVGATLLMVANLLSGGSSASLTLAVLWSQGQLPYVLLGGALSWVALERFRRRVRQTSEGHST